MSSKNHLIFRNHKADVFILLIGCLLVSGVSATYAGDKYLNVTYADTITGDYLFTTGNSTYRGSLESGKSYSAEFNISLPKDAVIRFQRLYVYWTWSSLNHKAIYPQFVVTRTDETGDRINPVNRYIDNKGFVSTNDFFCGVDTFEIPGLHPGQDKVVVSVEQAGPEGSSVALQGMAILIVYETKDAPPTQLQIMEGCDLLYSNYGISPEMATQTMDFKKPVDLPNIQQATLLLVAPSGGYSRSDIPDKNRLYMNWMPEENIPPLIRTVVSVLFPTFRGKEWSDIFESDETKQIGIEQRDVTAYLREQDNRIAVQDRGDYFQICNAILSIKLKR